MPLQLRFRIARGVARGLAYIHDKKQVHGNLKPSNILLTPEMEPIIADFGLGHLLPDGHTPQTDHLPRRPVSTQLPATSHDPPHDYSDSAAGVVSPYQPPEGLRSLKPNSKWDVYSFGVVLLELLTGRVFLEGDLDEMKAGGRWARDERSRILGMADVGVRGDVAGMEDATLACFKLGFNCTSRAPQKRPSMKEALQTLEKIAPAAH